MTLLWSTDMGRSTVMRMHYPDDPAYLLDENIVRDWRIRTSFRRVVNTLNVLIKLFFLSTCRLRGQRVYSE